MSLNSPPAERIINDEVANVSMRETRRWLYSLWQDFITLVSAVGTAQSAAESAQTTANNALPAASAVVGGGAGTVPKLDSQARLGIGTATPHGRLEVSSGTAGVSTGDLLLDINNAAGSNSVYLGRISTTAGDNTRIVFRNRGGVVMAQMNTGDGHFLAGPDNTQTLGGAGNRWSVVYAGTGAINTSDARQKADVRPFTDAEIAAAVDLSQEVGLYQFLAAIEQKGGGARLHTGLTVQRAIEIMQGHGLDPFRYGFICYDEWNDAFIEQSGDGEPVVTQTRVAGNAYGFRDNELDKFIIRGVHERLRRLEEKAGL